VTVWCDTPRSQHGGQDNAVHAILHWFQEHAQIASLSWAFRVSHTDYIILAGSVLTIRGESMLVKDKIGQSGKISRLE
jgi:hypothetical protein